MHGPSTKSIVCGPTCYSGVVPAGSTIGIPSTVNLGDAWIDTCWFGSSDRFAELRRYPTSDRRPAFAGIILYAEQAAETETTSQLANMRSDFVRIQPYLRVMRNQASNNVNGGGTPLRPMQPRIDPEHLPVIAWLCGRISGLPTENKSDASSRGLLCKFTINQLPEFVQ